MEQPNNLGIISKTNLFFIRLSCKLTAFRCSGRNRHLLAGLLCTLSNNNTCNYSLLHCIPHKPMFILKLICCSRAVYKLPLSRTPHVNDTIYKVGVLVIKRFLIRNVLYAPCLALQHTLTSCTAVGC